MGFPTLSTALGFGPPYHLPTQGTLLITDTLTSDASFLIHHIVTNALQTPPPAPHSPESPPSAGTMPTTAAMGVAKPRVIMVGLAHIFNHYLLISRKLGLNLLPQREQRQYIYIDGVSLTSPFAKHRRFHPADRSSQNPTAPDYYCPPFDPPTDCSHHATAYTSSQRYLTDLLHIIVGFMDIGGVGVGTGGSGDQSTPSPSLIFDDIAVLWNLGMHPSAILEFLQACKFHVESRNGSLTLLAHTDRCLSGQAQKADDEGPLATGGYEYFVKSLMYLASYILQAESLPSGHSRDVHGQLLHALRGNSGNMMERPNARSSCLASN
ncbi:hypothetical protein BJ085DRAFT_29145 [Dimargaris cristalligena]|uniref:Uncharacterized protein n=1 Tax=Dimargaris cristalligena TaxID=215637 RepID=A0A4P9ZNJ5_9FUNG|nr:hypothetical protein BJ085DRAFT_29145 [Dimargaris cristalligena]|eukprot:RKP33880.1 hypothetical protein BJ085DRAFT_29145 [Dimargaris cristalligena]